MAARGCASAGWYRGGLPVAIDSRWDRDYGRERLSPNDSIRTDRTRGIGYHLAWAFGWAVVGALVAVGIAVVRGSKGFLQVLELSVIFAEVVGFTALASARLVFPRLSGLPYSLSLPLQVLTLFSGTVFGCLAVLFVQPLYVAYQVTTAAMIITANALLGVIVGIALHTYDTLKRNAERGAERMFRLEREIEIAREVQLELLPRTLPTIRGLQLAAVCRPAVGVGGDFFDFLPHAEDRLGLVIADVSGKGIPAALLMAGIQASVRSIAIPGVSPAEVNRRLNDLLHDRTSDARYATLFFALYDGEAHTLNYCNAGHYPPLLIGQGGRVERLAACGLPIGALPGSTYSEGSRSLAPGDLLVLYTDGIIEAPSPSGEEYGDERLARLLIAHRERPPLETMNEVLEDVARWTEGAPAHDDLTIVLAQFS